jgi:hypothetical protein
MRVNDSEGPSREARRPLREAKAVFVNRAKADISESVYRCRCDPIPLRCPLATFEYTVQDVY